ncbi:hypothetical protein MCI89_14280 [Muricomes sp. OA1]|uniref:hypothetical protein n=1 Tax=Muricomes sp. OA1 TaxID=2914165 RepID=UPI001F0533D6|nr:hypothetical protein [Muricomes sp. OA1]MBS6765577.1 hypothetical protein [Clostridium sp.]MCH1973510.1 hypothetical protein [Muricomes sp. OA1]MDU7706103.1 hypothetical protein [Clostridium sp.]
MIVLKIIIVILALIFLGISAIVGGALLAYITVSALVYMVNGDYGVERLDVIVTEMLTRSGANEYE